MAITDKQGNKLPQVRVKKKVFAKNVRERRIMKGQDLNPAYCNLCGFRVRSVNHTKGKHHINNAPKKVRKE